ncbi:unnamed protein product [Durusdinium trenchii]|uniref:Uncharacterized protein n=1 Tax=Durusdinium trenchii TaxID=1381693 RepID=A0ABP0RJY6_9DINO
MAAAFWQWERQIFLICGYLRYIKHLERNVSVSDRDRSLCGLAVQMLNAEGPAKIREDLRRKYRKAENFKQELVKVLDMLVEGGLLICTQDPRKEAPKTKRRKRKQDEAAEVEAPSELPGQPASSRHALHLRKPAAVDLSEGAEAEATSLPAFAASWGPACFVTDKRVVASAGDQLDTGRLQEMSNTAKKRAVRLPRKPKASAAPPVRKAKKEPSLLLPSSRNEEAASASVNPVKPAAAPADFEQKTPAERLPQQRQDSLEKLAGCMACRRSVLLQKAERLQEAQQAASFPFIVPPPATLPGHVPLHDVKVQPEAAKLHADKHGHVTAPMRDREMTQWYLDLPHSVEFKLCPYRCLTCKQQSSSSAFGGSYFAITDTDIRKAFPGVCVVHRPKEKKHYLSRRYLFEVLVQFYCKLNCREVRRSLMDACCTSTIQTNFLHRVHAVPKSIVLRHIVVKAFGQCLDDIVTSFQEKMFLYNAQGVRHDGNMGLARRVVLPHSAGRYHASWPELRLQTFAPTPGDAKKRCVVPVQEMQEGCTVAGDPQHDIGGGQLTEMTRSAIIAT